MKFFTTLSLALALVLSMAGCGKSPVGDPQTVTMAATVLEIQEGYYLVEPVEGSRELNSADRLLVPMENMSPAMEPRVGDLIHVEYSGQIMETYPGQISGVSSITVFAQAEGVDEEPWGITLTAEDVTPTGMTLVITQSGGEPTGELEFGSDYHLEMIEGNIWTPVPYAIDPYNVTWTQEAYMVSMGDSIEVEIDWEYLYGGLTPGKYRLVKQFIDFRGTGDYDTQLYSAEFEIQ